MIPPSSSIRSSNTPAFQPIYPGKRQAVGLGQALASSSPVRFGGGNGEKAKFSFSETWKTLREHFKNGQNPEVARAFGKKYGSEVLFPALFAVPVVGWALSIVAMPFAWYFNRKGDKEVKKLGQNEKYKDHPALKADNIARQWSQKKTDAKTLVDNYNHFIDVLFPDSPEKPNANSKKLRGIFKIRPSIKESKVFQKIAQLVDAKNALENHWLNKIFLWPFNKMHDFLSGGIKLPKAITRIILLPRYAALALFYALKKAPK